MLRFMSSLRSLCTGLLLLPARPSSSDSSRLKAACAAVSYRLCIDLVHSSASIFEIMSPRELSDRLQQVYSDANAFAPHLDVRILLPPTPAAISSSAPAQLEARNISPKFKSYHMDQGYGAHVSMCVFRAEAYMLLLRQ
jgi:hypothetical protein